MAAICWEIAAVDIVEEAERHEFIRCMRSMAIHDN
jgi:hypothetical protein